MRYVLNIRWRARNHFYLKSRLLKFSDCHTGILYAVEVLNEHYPHILHAHFLKNFSQNRHLVPVGKLDGLKEVGHTRKHILDGRSTTLGSYEYIPVPVGYSAGSKKESGARGWEHKVNLVLYNQFIQQSRHRAHIAFIIIYEHLYG